MGEAMRKSKRLPKFRHGVPRFAVAELESKKARRFSIARIEGRVREGSAWRVTEDTFTSRQADGIAQQLNQLAQERAGSKADSCIVLNVKTLKARLCSLSVAKNLKAPDLVVD